MYDLSSWYDQYAGDDASGVNTECDPTLCSDTSASFYVCTTCPLGTTNAAGDDASGDNTECDPTLCGAKVRRFPCLHELSEATNAADDDASG